LRKDLLILLAVLIPAALLLLFLSSKFTNQNIPGPFASTTPFPTISRGTPSPGQIVTTAPASSVNIEVLSPRNGDKVKSGFAVKGNARVFENVVSIRLRDSMGNTLVETIAMANAPDTGQFGSFEKMIEFETLDTQGVLEVYQASPRDGSDTDKVSVPLEFSR
jgi:hypothetical protein